jgi:hypothetical protein
MAARQPRAAVKRLGSLSLFAFCATFALFAANVLIGRGRAAFGWEIPVPLDDVGEYVSLLLSALFFTVGTLIREYIEENAAGDDRPGETINPR